MTPLPHHYILCLPKCSSLANQLFHPVLSGIQLGSSPLMDWEIKSWEDQNHSLLTASKACPNRKLYSLTWQLIKSENGKLAAKKRPSDKLSGSDSKRGCRGMVDVSGRALYGCWCRVLTGNSNMFFFIPPQHAQSCLFIKVTSPTVRPVLDHITDGLSGISTSFTPSYLLFLHKLS